MEEIDSIISLFFALAYLWGVIAAIRFCLTRIHRGSFIKYVSVIVLFLLFNAPLKGYYYVIADVHRGETIIKQLINIALNTYILALMFFGIFSLSRTCYQLYTKNNKKLQNESKTT